MNKFAFGKKNFILLAIGMVIIIVGFILMSGSGSNENAFNPEIFSATRIKLAPLVCLVGFLFVIFAIMYNPNSRIEKKEDSNE